MLRPCKKCGVVFETQRCKLCDKAGSIKRSLENPEKRLASMKKWRDKNKEKMKELISCWRLRNSEKEKLRRAAYDVATKEIRRIREQRRRAIKAKSIGNLSKDISGKLFKKQRGMCACCKEPLGSKFHLDHIMPLALGGANEDWNIQLLRAICNQQKHVKHPIDFMQSRGYLI